MTATLNHALQRTPGFRVQLPGAALIRPAQSRAVRPAMKPGTARAFALRRSAHCHGPGPESPSLRSLGPFPMRLALAVTVLFMFVACASHPAPPTTAFDSRPRYPVTVIPLSPSLSLRHVARAPGIAEEWYSLSTYELVDADGTKLFTIPSMLDDPKWEGEFKAYYRANDRITVLTRSQVAPTA